MAQSETVERILDAAEQLFAEKGFAETSLRLITSKAGVNLAAVNYHFGSKKALIQAVFSRFLGPFCASLERELDRREALTDKKDTLEELLEILVEQALAVKPRSGDDLSIFMRCWACLSVRARATCAAIWKTCTARCSVATCSRCMTRRRPFRPSNCSGVCTSCLVRRHSACRVSRHCALFPRTILASEPR